MNKKMMKENEKFKFWREKLNSAKLIVAPMVDASELAWRLLSRKYGAQLCYTPMLHSHVFVKDPRYRRENLATCSEDRPLIVQFCANDPEIFAEACKLAAPHCDAIDLNLGCPQAIAKKGHYGAFLMDEWELIEKMIKRASSEVSVPITAKMRIFEDKEKTIEYAKMLETAGASIITVHGRTREQKGPLTGLASWEHIKCVCNAVTVPVFANGNIQFLSDIEPCLIATGTNGVMTAEGNLYNPALFTGEQISSWQLALEYLELVKQYPCPLSYSRGHIFKLFHHCFQLPEMSDIRSEMGRASTVEEMTRVTNLIKEHFIAYEEGRVKWTPAAGSPQEKLAFPPWICQPYVRIPIDEHQRRLEAGQQKSLADSKKRTGNSNELSRKKLKKLRRNPNKSFNPLVQRVYEICTCKNPRGNRCEYELCRKCCKAKCSNEILDCLGHKISIKSRHEKNPIKS